MLNQLIIIRAVLITEFVFILDLENGYLADDE